MNNNNNFDAIIIGGSYAGLSAAMALGRSMRKVLIIDSGKPCNRYTPHSHNFITHDGAVPADIAAQAKEQVLAYDTVTFYKDVVVKGEQTPQGFMITTQSGQVFSGRKLVFATGVRDIFPDIKGFEHSWGKSVIHCPYCHGYEFRGEKTAILANGERAFHLAALVSNLTDQVVVVPQGPPDFTEEQWERLRKNNIDVIEGEVAEIRHQNGQAEALIFKDGHREAVAAAYASVPFEQHCDIPARLGCELTDSGHLKVDTFQKTTVPGIFACGDNSLMMRSVSAAVSSGGVAGAMVNNELTMDSF